MVLKFLQTKYSRIKNPLITVKVFWKTKKMILFASYHLPLFFSLVDFTSETIPDFHEISFFFVLVTLHPTGSCGKLYRTFDGFVSKFFQSAT